VGVDLSAPMLARGRTAASGEGIANVRFEQGDAQVHPFTEGGFDVAISRGGILFFADPVAAFANICRALQPGGRIAFACPQEMRRNDWFLIPITALLGEEPPAAAQGSPGMFSLADPNRIDDVLTEAGFQDVTAQPVEVLMHYGRDADDAAAFILSTGPVQFHLRAAGQPAKDQALTALTAALRPHEQPDALRLRGAWWVVTATRR
jgi:SAM-dependent methyltransferase